MEEKNDTIKKLNTDLKLKEEELCNINKKLEYVCNHLWFEFQCQNMKLINPNPQNNEQVEKKVDFEQDILPSKLMIVCEKLRETKKAYDEAKNIIKNDIFSIKNSVVTIEKLVEVGENNQYKVLSNQVQKLKERNDMKDEELRFMKKKVKELERRNEYNLLKINKQKKKLLESKLKIENLETNCDQTNQPCDNYFSLEKKLNNLFKLLPVKYNSINSNIKL